MRRINTAQAPFRLRVYRPTPEQGTPVGVEGSDSRGAEAEAAEGGPAVGAAGAAPPDVEEGAERTAEVAARPGQGSLSGALGTGLGALGRGIAYLPLRAMDVLDWLRTESHRRGTEVEEVDAEITVWEKPTGCVGPLWGAARATPHPHTPCVACAGRAGTCRPRRAHCTGWPSAR